MKWYTVDEYPEDRKGVMYPVLLSWDGYIAMGIREEDGRRKTKWRLFSCGIDGKFIRTNEPTHWAPLPEAPTKPKLLEE
jgi:expansin (peptidoglycan-binding protein)